MNIRFNKNNLMPKKDVLTEAVIVGIVASIVYFGLNFFGISLNVSKGWEVFIIVTCSVYLKHIFEVKL